MANQAAKRRQKALERKKKKRKAKRQSGSVERSGRSHLARMKRTGGWPLRETLIGEGWRESGLAQVLIARDRPGGGVAIGIFLVDLGCLGVKNCIADDDVTEVEYRALVDKLGSQEAMVPIDPASAVKLVTVGLEYAAGLGFKPERDYVLAREMFGDIDPEESDLEVPCGKAGLPCYVPGPDDDVDRVLSQLEARVGPDGFLFGVQSVR